MALALTGCANLGAIQEFGALSADSASYTALTDDYLTSPERSKRHTLRLDDAKRATLAQQAKARAPQRAQLQLYHTTVTAYMAALAALAADEVTSYDGQLDPLVDAASKGGLIAGDKAGMVKSISKLLADAATNAYRQRELKRLIANGNAPLQGVIADMHRIMAGFDSAVADEAEQYEDYYDALITLAGKKEPVAAELLWAQREATLLGLDQRKRAIPRYAETLRMIAVAHQSLFDNRDRIANKEVLAQLRKYTTAIRHSYKQARAAANSEQ